MIGLFDLSRIPCEIYNYSIIIDNSFYMIGLFDLSTIPY